MQDLSITVEKVYAALQYLNGSSAVGPDNLHPRVLTMCELQLLGPLAMVLRICLRLGYSRSVTGVNCGTIIFGF